MGVKEMFKTLGPNQFFFSLVALFLVIKRTCIFLGGFLATETSISQIKQKITKQANHNRHVYLVNMTVHFQKC